jgi:hypothetical protein
MTTQAEQGLLPCPWCGAAAEWQKGEYGDGKEWKYLACSECECMQPYASRDSSDYEGDCIKVWNTRVSSPHAAASGTETLVDRVRTLEEALRNFVVYDGSPEALSLEEAIEIARKALGKPHA